MYKIQTLLSMVYLSTGANNTVGLWTFGILFFARICAKLNLFLGVPSINSEFLPSPVAHLASYFRVGSTSWFFPVSISLISFTLFFLVDNIFDVENQISTTIGFTLLASFFFFFLRCFCWPSQTKEPNSRVSGMSSQGFNASYQFMKMPTQVGDRVNFGYVQAAQSMEIG